MKSLFRRLLPFAFFVLVAFAPSLTRYIWKMGNLAGHEIEPGTISLYGMQLVAAVYVLLVFGSRTRVQWRGFFRRNEVAVSGLLAVVAVVASLRSDAPLSSVVAALTVVLGVLVSWAVMLHRPDPHETVALFFGAAVFQAAFGIPQFFTQEVIASKWLGTAAHTAGDLGAFVVETATGRWLRSYGLLPHPNVYGTLVALGLIAAIGLAGHRLITASERYRKAVAAAPDSGSYARFRLWARFSPLRFYALMPFLTVGLLFSFSRSAFIAFAAGFAWLVVGAWSGAAPAVRRVIRPAAVIIVVSLLAIGFAFRDPLRVRATVDGRLEYQSVSSRFIQFADAWELFSRQPFSGIGMSRMPYLVRLQVDGGRQWWEYDYIHDVPALVAVETGLPGLACWFVAVALGLIAAYRRLRHRGPTLTGTTAFAAMFIALLVAGLFDHFLWSSWFGQLLFWIVLGMLHVSEEKARGRG